MHFGRYLLNKTESAGINRNSFEGCTTEEIQALMVSQGVERLPKKYVEYLEVMGKRTPFMLEEAIRYNELLGVKDQLKRFLEVELPIDFDFPKDSFVVRMYWGASTPVAYFHTDSELDDPPIHLWVESGNSKGYEITIESDNFTEYFENLIDGYIKLWTESRERQKTNDKSMAEKIAGRDVRHQNLQPIPPETVWQQVMNLVRRWFD
ncbi:MAG: SMI1/KNR4 family protein [Chloroflexota bacterium]